MRSDELLARALKLLQGSIRASELTQTEIDERIGRRRGYLSHVFQRRVDLKLVDLLKALHVLGIHPGIFFAAVTDSSGTGLIELLRETDPGGGPPRGAPAAAPGPAGGSKDSAFEERVRLALRRIVRELAARDETRSERG